MMRMNDGERLRVTESGLEAGGTGNVGEEKGKQADAVSLHEGFDFVAVFLVGGEGHAGRRIAMEVEMGSLGK